MNHKSVLDQEDPTPEVHWIWGPGGLLGFLGIVPRVRRLGRDAVQSVERRAALPVGKPAIVPVPPAVVPEWKTTLEESASRVPRVRS